MAFLVFKFPPAQRLVIYVSDTQYFIEWACARYYLSNSEHFFQRAAVLLKYQKPDGERFIMASIVITLATVVIEKIVWFQTHGLGRSHTFTEFEWWLEIFASVTFVWRLHGLFVVANIILVVITSHLLEMRYFCQRIKGGDIALVTESDRTAALKEHTTILHGIMTSSKLISATMGASAAMSLLSVILILWYIVAGDAQLNLLLSVFDCEFAYIASSS